VATVVCVPLTSNLKWAEAPGNVALPGKSTGLSKDSVANVSQVVSLDRDVLTERVGRVSKKQLELVFAGLDLVMGR
jgi:mRNA interferase MazF